MNGLDRVGRMGHTHINAPPPDQRQLAAHDLLAGERLLATESRFLFGRRTNLPQGSRPTGEAELREVLRQGFPTPFALTGERRRALLVLIDAAGLNTEVWGKENKDAADRRIRQARNATWRPHCLLWDAYNYTLCGLGDETLDPLRVQAVIPW